MGRTFAIGVALTTLGVGAYLVGTGISYPGRAFSVTAVMVGFTLLSVGGVGRDETE